MKKILQVFFAIIFVLFILFFGLKGILKTVLQFDNYESYSNIDSRGQINLILILPPNELIFAKKYHEYYEMALYQVTGNNAVHYFGPLYNIGDTPLGIRIYPKAKEVWNAEFELKDKTGNLSESTFPEPGKQYTMDIIFYNDKISINGDKFAKDSLTAVEINAIREIFKNK